MGFRRETRHEDRDRTQGLMTALGGSLNPPDVPTSPEHEKFNTIVAGALYANNSAEPPAGHKYPKRG
ncbi:hypothetical protein [Streptomyces sp. NBC_01353]|uniref:hypothetical protein n=1 Tax=Streptomyces sp. NBC_01353 TaxID=2903835 RepID=UPI002E30EA9A|nr:hypothetical protein [Streptomyces sp. NBC_01353]